MRARDGEGADGTRLAGRAKVYVPIDVEPSRAPLGFVFAIRAQAHDGRVVLRLVAYGERHPSAGRSVPTGASTAAIPLRGRRPAVGSPGCKA